MFKIHKNTTIIIVIFAVFTIQYPFMCTTFEYDNYTITTSLNERYIYIKVSDNLNFVNYDGNVDSKELRLTFELCEIYQLITKCILKETGYSLKLGIDVVNSISFMRLNFNANVGGILKVQFEGRLREKVLSNDAQLTSTINKMELKYSSLVQKMVALEKRFETEQTKSNFLIECISNAHIYMGNSNVFLLKLVYNINSTNIVLNAYEASSNGVGIVYSKLIYLYNLEKAHFKGYRINDFNNVKNNTIKELTISCDTTAAKNTGDNLNCIRGFECIENFPKLEKIIVSDAPELCNVVSVLSKLTHNIKSMTFEKCPKLNLVELNKYCLDKKIELNIT